MPSGLGSNEVRALAAIFSAQALTRAELARRLGLTRSTIGLLVQSLADSDLVRERELPGTVTDIEARLGRPGIEIEIAGGNIVFLGGYIGVNTIELVAIDLSGTVRAEKTCAFGGAGSAPVEAIETLIGLVREVRAQLDVQMRVLGLAVAVPGFVSSLGAVYHATILGWHDTDVLGLLEAGLAGEMPVFVENDANAVALAEAYNASNGDQMEDTLVVLIENGVGGGIVSDGKIYRGQFGGAGEIGHIPIGNEAYIHDGSRPGRFESFVGKDALLARHAYIAGHRADFSEFLDALGSQDSSATAAAKDWAHWLARGLAVLTSVLQPGRIVLTGSVSAVFPFVIDTVETQFADRLIEGFPVPRIELSRTGANGPALGAALGLHQMAMHGDERFSLRPPPQADTTSEGRIYAAQG